MPVSLIISPSGLSSQVRDAVRYIPLRSVVLHDPEHHGPVGESFLGVGRHRHGQFQAADNAARGLLPQMRTWLKTTPPQW
ncbi:hypothetical protein AOZ06_43975 [Kibdelosporangium phytohabitans]|uniref:Uncharacterized protein n=1 Tax=Kibdelosporangium phytohabitans TaxID=860235 RepID=A0A0N9I919_9PSEU|nr:hypothetical protein [Kibdelosporangium phytohabitans]ALG12894.1 hypothetical protein AOZ06_43975 [Kibdelosporangium phytohabitans]